MRQLVFPTAFRRRVFVFERKVNFCKHEYLFILKSGIRTHDTVRHTLYTRITPLATECPWNLTVVGGRGAATRVDGGICPPTLKSRGTFYVIAPPPYFYHNIYVDWLVPLHTIVPAPLVRVWRFNEVGARLTSMPSSP